MVKSFETRSSVALAAATSKIRQRTPSQEPPELAELFQCSIYLWNLYSATSR